MVSVSQRCDTPNPRLLSAKGRALWGPNLGDFWSPSSSAWGYVGFMGLSQPLSAAGDAVTALCAGALNSPGAQSAFHPGEITSAQEMSCEVLAVQGKQAIRNYISINARLALFITLCITMNV